MQVRDLGLVDFAWILRGFLVEREEELKCFYGV